jgi:ACT domain-containing protein
MIKDKQKVEFIEQLKKIPIIQIVCERTGISRATYYRWRKENKNFCEEADAAIVDGETLIGELSESQLISLIKSKNFQAIKLWLKTHNPKYSNKIEITGNLSIKEEPLSSEQQKLVKEALGLAGLLEVKENEHGDISAEPTERNKS